MAKVKPAIAGSISGSDFVEMFVGVGAIIIIPYMVNKAKMVEKIALAKILFLAFLVLILWKCLLEWGL